MNALEQASCFLDIALSLANEFVDDTNSSTYSVPYLLEMAKAALDASICGMMREAQQ
ncbi:hypothetical protein CCP3SC15_100030 [Gammaproteobacteria bacterium]